MFKLKYDLKKRMKEDNIYLGIKNKIVKEDNTYELSDNDVETLIINLVERIELQNKLITKLNKLAKGK